jgi:hypothetical protein
MGAAQFLIIDGCAVTTRIRRREDDFWVTVISRKRSGTEGKWVVSDTFELPFPLSTSAAAEHHAAQVLSSINGMSDDGKPMYCTRVIDDLPDHRYEQQPMVIGTRSETAMKYRGQVVRMEIREVPGGYNWTYHLNDTAHHSPGRPLPDAHAIEMEGEAAARRRIDRLIDSGVLVHRF